MPAGTAALPGVVVRSAAVDARAGISSVPQVQLPQVPGQQLREQLDPGAGREQPDGPDRGSCTTKRCETKNQIVQANLRLVVSIAKRHVSASDDFFGLVSDGNMSLIRAVEKFDYARGNKFSTYASWAIMKNFARTIPDEFKHRDRFRTSHDEMFDCAAGRAVGSVRAGKRPAPAGTADRTDPVSA